MLMGTFGVPLGVSSLDLAQPNVGGGAVVDGWMDGTYIIFRIRKVLQICFVR